MATADESLLRAQLGEKIGTGETELDTLFTDQEITDLLARHEGVVSDCMVEGWQMKAAALADLVDTIEGSSRRAMSDLHKNALAQLKYYQGLADVVVEEAAVTRVHRIVRQ